MDDQNAALLRLLLLRYDASLLRFFCSFANMHTQGFLLIRPGKEFKLLKKSKIGLWVQSPRPSLFSLLDYVCSFLSAQPFDARARSLLPSLSLSLSFSFLPHPRYFQSPLSLPFFKTTTTSCTAFSTSTHTSTHTSTVSLQTTQH